MKFVYKSLVNGAIVKKSIEADNRQKLVEYLKSHNYLIIDIQEQRPGLGDMVKKLFSRNNANDIVDFTRQLSMMFNAGLTIIDSLDILKKQETKPQMVTLINDIDENIRAGNSFSQTLLRHPKLFSNLYIALVRAGEASGKLDEILLKLADTMEKERQFKSKVKGALVYPVFIIVGMIIVMFIMMTFVIPKLLEMYKDFDAELPAATQLVINISSFFQHYWILLIALAALGNMLVARFVKTTRGKLWRDSMLLKLPVFSKIIKSATLVDATRTLSILIASGVAILDALDIVSQVTGNVVFQNAFKQIRAQVEKGETLGRAFQGTEIFPPILVQMATVGEQTGHIDETLQRVSAFFEFESEQAVKTMTTLIEPAILICLGLGVGFLVVSIILPIYNLTSSIK